MSGDGRRWRDGERVKLYNICEPEEAVLCSEFLRYDDKVLLAGAGLGWLSCWCALITGPENLVCYEAQPYLAKLAKKAIAVNGQQLDIRPGVLGLADETVAFYICDAWAGSSVLGPRPETATNVQGIDTNRILREEKPTALVLDIEGGEFALIPGLEMPTVRLVILETHGDCVSVDKEAAMWECLTGQFRVERVIRRESDAKMRFCVLSRELP